MALSTPREDLTPVAAAYAEVTREWARHLRTYSQSVLLYQQASRRRPNTVLPVQPPPDILPEAPRHYQLVEIVDDADRQRALASPEPRNGTRAGSGPLTRRQVEIAMLIVQGLTNAQIADRLVVSQGTVGNHIGQMLRRLGAKNRAEIAVWAIRHEVQ